MQNGVCNARQTLLSRSEQNQRHRPRRISVAIFARQQSESGLRSILRQFDVVYTRSWAELEFRLTNGAFRTAILDPGLLTVSDAKSVTAFKSHHPEVAFISYASLDGASLQTVARMACDGFLFNDVLVHEGCCRYTVRRAVERASSQGLVTEVLGQLETDLSTLPESVGQILFDLFARPSHYTKVCDLATACRVKVRTLYRILNHARLGSPKNPDARQGLPRLLSFAQFGCFGKRNRNASRLSP